ncbi:MAG TPA: permease-like cell division protein FtsX [Candidatus Paceibacterota bacterium]|nr:permease-like cell division protein FtsX [Candidatus Paceibacterota bacterium]
MMNWTNIRRMITTGAKNFSRGGAVTVATVVIMTVTVGIIAALIFLSAILTSTLDSIKDKVDINVYFVTTASDADIQTLIGKVQQLPEVESVTYTDRDQALADFKERHASDQLTLQALDELGANPLDASIAIKAKDPSEYGAIADFLSSDPALSANGTSIIDRVNYYQNQTVIDRLTGAIRTTERAGIVIVILFALASILIAFATIRLAIYSSRDEIAVMRLVGAANGYIRGPFIVAGIMAGLIAALIVLILLFPVAWYAGGALESWLAGFNLFNYYIHDFPLIFLVLVGSGALLGGLASVIAVRRYLKI